MRRIFINKKNIENKKFNSENHKINYINLWLRNNLDNFARKLVKEWKEIESNHNDMDLAKYSSETYTIQGPFQEIIKGTNIYNLIQEIGAEKINTIHLTNYVWKFELNKEFTKRMNEISRYRKYAMSYSRINFPEYNNEQFVSFNSIKRLFLMIYRNSIFDEIAKIINHDNFDYIYVNNPKTNSKRNWKEHVLAQKGLKPKDECVPLRIMGYNVNIIMEFNDYAKEISDYKYGKKQSFQYEGNGDFVEYRNLDAAELKELFDNIKFIK